MNSDFPSPDMELTHILVVKDMERARSFYRDVFGKGGGVMGTSGKRALIMHSDWKSP
jgi:predicted enzyme related to lactoylglutathione lyase